jgi:hypothetical protein
VLDLFGQPIGCHLRVVSNMQCMVAGFTSCVDQLPCVFPFLIEFVRFDANPFRFCRMIPGMAGFLTPAGSPPILTLSNHGRRQLDRSDGHIPG